MARGSLTLPALTVDVHRSPALQVEDAPGKIRLCLGDSGDLLTPSQSPVVKMSGHFHLDRVQVSPIESIVKPKERDVVDKKQPSAQRTNRAAGLEVKEGNVVVGEPLLVRLSSGGQATAVIVVREARDRDAAGIEVANTDLVTV